MACRSAIPDAGAALIERLRATRNALPEPEVLAETLARDLLEWPDGAWLVLDDYHTLLDSPPSERFVEDLFRRAKIRALILTRRRPSWLSARQLIHGEAHELGANVLAMTHGEACAVLDDEEGQRVSGLLALTQGWPAVIGLAALSGASVIDLEDLLPETLHTYFAEELYQCLDDDLKDALLDLSLAPTISNTVGFELFGPKGERLLLRCAESGFLTAFGAGAYELHPLLRQFLLTKVGHVSNDLEARVERIARLTQRHRRWDDASVLIEKFGADGIIDGFLEAAVDDLLRAGRIETLRRWIANARGRAYQSPQVDLAEAELLFREAKPRRAEDLALAALEALPPGHRLRARSLNIAALSAHFDSRPEEALERHIQAAGCAVSTEDKRNAIWGQFITRGELGRKDDALATIALFEETRPTTREDRLREAQAHITFATRFGGIERALRRWGHFSDLVDARCDPLVMSGFLHTLGQALLLSTRYQEAVELTEHQEAEALRLGLDFVLSHTLCLRTGAEIGLRDFDAARVTLRRATPIVRKFDDDHSAANLAVLEAELCLVESLPAQAADVLEAEPEEWSNPGMAGEFVGVHALASACAGDLGAAKDLVERSAQCSDQIEALMPRLWALAVISHVESGDAGLVNRTYEEAVRSGHMDSVVLAYRAYRPILGILANNKSYRPRLKHLIEDARDYGLARSLQLGVSAPPDTAKLALTAREREVLDLVRRGLSNAEIGQALWIEESTAKVHVRHILRKLGVRTRTEAAVFAARLENGQL